MISDRIFAFGVAVLLLNSVNAQGQEQNATEFFDRTKSKPPSLESAAALKPLPIDSQGFEVLPEVEFSAGYSSNVLTRETNEVADNYVGFSPKISISSDWSQHELLGDVRIRHIEFSELSGEGRTEINFGLRGRLDTGEKSSISVEVIGADEAEDRTALASVPDAVEPTDVARFGGRVGLSNTINRIQMDGDVLFESYDYEDAELASDLIQDQDFRDHDELIGSFKVTYALNPRAAVYSSVSHTVADYSPPNIFNAFNRDFDGTVLLFGVDFGVGSNVRGDVGLGYQRYVYDDDSFEDIDDVSFVGNLDWLIGGRTLLSASTKRSVFDPGLITTNAAIETAAGLDIEQALTSKFSVNGGAHLSRYDFENIDRDDDRIGLKLGANWKLNKSLWIEGGYELFDQRSSFQAFTDNRFLLKMRVFP